MSLDRNLSELEFIESAIDAIDNAAVALGWLLSRDNGGETFQVEVIAETMALAIHAKSSSARDSLTRLYTRLSAASEAHSHG